MPVATPGFGAGADVFVARAAGSAVGEIATANFVGASVGVPDSGEATAGGCAADAGDGAPSGLAAVGKTLLGTVGALVGVAEPQPVISAINSSVPKTIKPTRPELVRC